MKLKLMPLSLLLILVVALASCGKKSNVPVPADAAMALHIDGESIASKLSWDEIKQSDWFRILQEKTKDTVSLEVLNDPEASGVDVKSDMYFFIKMVGQKGYSGFVGTVKDESKFASFMQKSTKGQAPVKQGDLMVLSHEGSIMTWKDKRFVMISNVSYEMQELAPGTMGRDQEYGSAPGFSNDSLVKFANDVYAISGKSSLGNDERFTSLLKENGDIHFWVSAGNMYGGALPSILALTKIELLLKGNVTAATLNFDNGKISIDGKSYYNKELEALYRKHQMKNIDEAMLKMIPSKNVAAVMAMNYPPEGLKEFLVVLGLDGILNAMLAQEGYSVDDFIRANKGDVLFAVSDFGVKTPMVTDTTFSPSGMPKGKIGANILFATSVNDKAAFQKLMDLLRSMVEKQGGAAAMAAMGKIPYQLKDNWFIAGNDSISVSGFGTASSNHAFISRIKGHPMGGYLDIQQFINGGRSMYDSVGLLIADQSLKTWQDIVFYGGEFKNNATESHVEINMVDKSTNSLKQLNNYLGFVAKVMKENDKLKEVEVQQTPPALDSVVVPKPMAEPKSN